MKRNTRRTLLTLIMLIPLGLGVSSGNFILIALGVLFAFIAKKWMW